LRDTRLRDLPFLCFLLLLKSWSLAFKSSSPTSWTPSHRSHPLSTSQKPSPSGHPAGSQIVLPRLMESTCTTQNLGQPRTMRVGAREPGSPSGGLKCLLPSGHSCQEPQESVLLLQVGVSWQLFSFFSYTLFSGLHLISFRTSILKPSLPPLSQHLS